MSVTTPVLSIRNAARAFGRSTALDGVDLAVAPGELLALLGPNGAGKTTLIRAICGRVRLDAGEILLGDADPTRRANARPTLGLVPQDVALYSHLTVRENLEVFGALAGVPAGRRDAAVARALDWTGLADRAGQRTDRLSGGMKRRLNLAAGVLHAPRLLLLDEPTVGVDPAARDALHDVIRALRDEGMGILLTTHDLEQAAELADRIAIMSNGRICAEGTLEALLRERFAGERELTVTLRAIPGDAGREAMKSLGMRVTSNERSWTGRVGRATDAMVDLARRLEGAGLEAAEVRVREPDLRAVFLHVTGREFEA